jgi:8-amino-7-oxononanoate synthase
MADDAISWTDWTAAELADLDARGLRRRPRCIERFDGRTARLDGREVLVAASNGYLGLAHHPEVIAAAREALEAGGASSASSRLLVGDHPIHGALEAECAAFAGKPAALVVGSGFLANTGLMAVLGDGAGIASDRLNHASIVDGCRWARGAEVVPYDHADAGAAAAALEGWAGRGRRAMLVTESVFSVDGDLAPLSALAGVARSAGALFVVDEAHGLGAAGATGRGGLESEGIVGGADVVVGTFGKALGSYGAFVAGSGDLRELLVSRMRTEIYSTALPPAVAAAALAAVRLLRRDPSPVARLQANARLLRRRLAEAGFDVAGAPWSPIVPVVVGGNEEALAAAAVLLEEGVLAPALRPPTVPPGTARIRFSVSALHTDEDLERIAAAAARRLPRVVMSGSGERGR